MGKSVKNRTPNDNDKTHVESRVSKQDSKIPPVVGEGDVEGLFKVLVGRRERAEFAGFCRGRIHQITAGSFDVTFQVRATGLIDRRVQSDKLLRGADYGLVPKS